MTTLTQETLSSPPEGRTADTGAAVVVARTGSISVVRAHGQLGQVAGQARDAAVVELAEAPAAVVCDLSGVTGPREPCAVSLLASLGAHAQHWPGTPVGVLCPDHALRRALEHEVLSRHLQIAASQSLLWPLLSEGAASTTVRESLVLAPTALAARAARDLVSRACLDWGRSSQIQAATLVVSELVTNAMVHAGTDLEVSLTRCGPRLRIAVKDHSSRVPRLQDAGSSGVTGRGLVLVDAVSESWGALPTGDGGKVVWAVILERAWTAPASSQSRSADERRRVAGRVHSNTMVPESIQRDGRIRFIGTDEIDPLLDVEARRLISGVEAFIKIQGTMRQPELSFRSNPPLEETDVLSLIIFDQPINELGEGQQASLAQRAGDLAGGYLASGLARSIGSALNLSEFELKAVDENSSGRA